MKNVDDLIDSAGELAERGLSKGEIADELNVSRDTASWLVDRSGVGAGAGAGGVQPGRAGMADVPVSDPQDIHIDWSAFGRDSVRLTHLGKAMANLLSTHAEEVDLIVGIEKAGAPIATVVARELEADLAAYAPRKHQWDEGDIDDYGGSFSRNFATIRGRDCFIVDDTITTGTTMTETIEAIREEGGNPCACCVLVDKRGVDDLEGAPVHSLINVVRVESQD
jgi:orotate phosphoribosyltransferase